MTVLDRKLITLPAAGALSGSELLYILQNGIDSKIPVEQITAPGNEFVIELTDGSTVTVDASLGNIFHLLAAGDRTILAPINAPGVNRTQRLIIRHQASGANRNLTLATGAPGSFRFGTTVPSLTTTTIGTTDYFGCIWNEPQSRWDVVAYAKGF